jgi:class II poly(R)-hydroxyalkanoic acid synthase
VASKHRNGSSGAALDVLLTDAVAGNPLQRVVRQPGALVKTVARIGLRPDRIARRAAGLTRDVAEIAGGRSEIAPPRGDKRFADPAWQKNWMFRRLAQTYIAAGTHADGLIDDAHLDWRADTMARFVAGNVHDLLAPTNFPWSNPAVLKETLDQGGANLVKGVRRAGRDVGARRLPAMVDTSRFEVGGNVAVTPGAVVLRTEVFELIQYAPSTAQVQSLPVLVVPPTINKYYVLDLAPGRSIAEHLIGEGLQTFMISWRNPGTEQGHYDFDTYADAIMQARDAVAAICRQQRVHLAAACSGGILTAGLLGHLAATGRLDEHVASLSLMVCALDNARAGTASALVSHELAAVAMAESARKGYLDAKSLANVFAWLRPNDLVWGYVINNYLMGKPPPAFDILFWNQDGARLSAGLHRDFVHMALENTMAKPGGMTVLDTPVDLGDVDIDVYAVAGLNDHIVPWENAYRGARLFGRTPRFVLSTSGHVQALINPPGPQSRSSYRVAEELPEDETAFFRDVPTFSGSWWTDWSAWLLERSGAPKAAPKTLGSTKHKPLAKAPGNYVHAS